LPGISPLESILVKNVTETLGIGSRAPEFSLAAANREGVFPLSKLRAGGPVILEFLRGTW
jgi:peroxiredoxin